MLGYIFEKYINQQAFGAYYTRPEITEYLCGRTIHRLIPDKVKQPAVLDLRLPARHLNSVAELLLNLDAAAMQQAVIGGVTRSYRGLNAEPGAYQK